MLMMIAATLISIAIVYYFTKNYKSDSAQLMTPRVPVPTMGIQIVCGDCAGEHEMPVRTLLDQNGNCENCGGHSYILASSMALHTLQLRAARVAEAASAGSGRVLAFEPRQKLAV